MYPPLMARLAAPIAAVSGLLLVLAIAAAWYVRDMQERASGPIATSVASVIAAQELEISIREVNAQFQRYLVTLDRKHLEPVPRLKQRTAEALAQAEREATTPAEVALMKRARQGYDHFFSEYDKVLRDPPKQGFYPRVLELIEEVLAKEILEPAHEYLRLNEGMLTQANETNQQLAERLTVGLMALGLFGSAGGLLAGWVIAAAVRRTMLRTEERLRDTADQLTRAVPESGRPAGAAKPGQDSLERVANSVSAVLRRLEESERAALRAEQLASVGQMAAGIAHEVRNPLMAIKLLIQAAAERAGGLKPRDVRVLEDEITRLEGIVSGFLDFARPPRPEPRLVDVRSLVGQVAENFRPRAEAQGVALEVRADRDARVLADPNQLRQVLYNLLFNALEAQPGGGGIEVVAEPASPEGGLTVTVSDDGPGVPPELGERIFDPFVSTKETGTGLGLSVCRRIAESHGGTLTAEPRPKGAAFVLTLPPARLPVAV